MNKAKTLTILLSLACTSTLFAGCAKTKTNTKEDRTADFSWSVNETISPESKWINSMLEKSVDETTDVSLKDDFYTAINKEDLVKWESTVAENFQEGNVYDEVYATTDQLYGILFGTTELHESNVEMNQKDIDHDIQIVQDFAKVMNNWEKRNKDGVEALRPFLEAIENIKTLDDLNKFIINMDGTALCDPNLVNMGVDATFQEVEDNAVTLENNPTYTLVSGTSLKKDVYLGSNTDAVPDLRDMNKKNVSNLLTKLGYSESEIDSIIHNCYEFETKLAENSLPSDYFETEEFMEEYSANTTKEELEAMQGNYPLMEIIESRGYGKEDKFSVVDANYVKALGSVYSEGNLEQMKAMYIVRTVLAAQTLLDEDTLSDYYDTTVASEDSTEQKKKEYIDSLVRNNVENYLRGPLSVVYISQYCTPEQKEDLTKLCDQVKETLGEIFAQEKWLKDVTKEKALEKLSYIEDHILYPETFDSYDCYTVDPDDSLLNVVAKLQQQKRCSDAKKVNTKVDRADWDLEDPNTTALQTNCCYVPTKNGIYICPGFVAAGKTYNVNMTKEQKYAAATVIGHELTHGFDTSGYQFDKLGYKRAWWDTEDAIAFGTQQTPLVKYYNSINPYPGSDNYTGKTVSGEAIADLGGLKAVLGMASKDKDFDYDAFFRAYATMWSGKLAGELASGMLSDVHPAGFIRVNVGLAQFDEFQKTYDIQPGDGMYVAPKNRILVW